MQGCEYDAIMSVLCLWQCFAYGMQHGVYVYVHLVCYARRLLFKPSQLASTYVDFALTPQSPSDIFNDLVYSATPNCTATDVDQVRHSWHPHS